MMINNVLSPVGAPKRHAGTDEQYHLCACTERNWSNGTTDVNIQKKMFKLLSGGSKVKVKTNCELQKIKRSVERRLHAV